MILSLVMVDPPPPYNPMEPTVERDGFVCIWDRKPMFEIHVLVLPTHRVTSPEECSDPSIIIRLEVGGPFVTLVTTDTLCRHMSLKKSFLASKNYPILLIVSFRIPSTITKDLQTDLSFTCCKAMGFMQTQVKIRFTATFLRVVCLRNFH